MTKYIDRKLLEHAIWTPADAVATPKHEPTPAQPQPTVLEGNYILMDQTDTYAKGVHALRKACQKDATSPHPTFTQADGSILYRPLTFKENIQARVTDYNILHDEEGNERALEDRLRLFDERWIDSCTGVAYKTGTTLFKINPICPELITIKKGFNEEFLSIEYDTIAGVELDVNNGKYNESLTKKEVINHQAWLAAVEDDRALLKEYRNIVFAQLKARSGSEKGMVFYVTDVGEEDELRALCVNYLSYNSGAYGNYILLSGGSFLLVAPSGAAGASRKK